MKNSQKDQNQVPKLLGRAIQLLKLQEEVHVKFLDDHSHRFLNFVNFFLQLRIEVLELGLEV